jgi:hypothetical protein
MEQPAAGNSGLAKAPPKAAKPRALLYLVNAKRKAEGEAYGTAAAAAAAEGPSKKQAGSAQGASNGQGEEGGGPAEDAGLGGLLGYGTGSDSN